MKLSKPQLLETIRDTIYEVLEEEIDKKIKRTKLFGAKKRLTEAKKARSKILQAVKARANKRNKIKTKKAQLKEVYRRLVEIEKNLNKK